MIWRAQNQVKTPWGLEKRESREIGAERSKLFKVIESQPHGGWRVSPQPKAVIGKHSAPIDTPGVHGAYILFKSSQRSNEE